MNSISLRTHGYLLEDERRAALRWHKVAEADAAVPEIYLRFAFVTRGREAHLFPAFLLDDWGKEIRGRKVYQWVAEYGEQFPRAEVFGFTRRGVETQFFLRELELYARLPCYAYVDKQQPLQEGVLVTAILQPDAAVATPQRTTLPADVKRPLAAARVSWWRVPTGPLQLDAAWLAPPDPGF